MLIQRSVTSVRESFRFRRARTNSWVDSKVISFDPCWKRPLMTGQQSRFQESTLLLTAS